MAGLPAAREMATTVLGQQISLPVLISPTGVQAVHPDGEVAVARAAAARGTVMSLSSFASKPVEEVLAANPRTFFQMYWVGGREEMAARMERARAAGAVGLIATLDWSFSFGRDWGSPTLPSATLFFACRPGCRSIPGRPLSTLITRRSTSVVPGRRLILALGEGIVASQPALRQSLSQPVRAESGGDSVGCRRGDGYRPG